MDAGASGGMMFRVNPAGSGGNAWNGYYAGITRTGGVVLTRIKDGTVTELGTATAGTSGWYHMKIEAVGDQIKVYVGNMSTPLITVTDKTYATGGMGLRTVNGGGAFNNYTAYPLQ